MTPNPVLALVLFATGVSLLWGGWKEWNRLRRAQKIVVRAWQYAETAFGYRREVLPRLLIAVRAAGISGAESEYRVLWEMSGSAKAAELSGNRRLMMEAEQKISLHLYHLLETCEKARNNSGLPDTLATLCDEARDREQHISAVREGWNDASQAVRVYRRTFPMLLLANVLFPHDLPLFVGQAESESGNR